MSTFSLRFIMPLSMLALASCQNSERPVSVPAASQLAQLSSLVTSASWLRQHCNRSDIPEDGVLAKKALELAEQRGWSVNQDYRQRLTQEVSIRSSALSADSPALAEKCAALNPSAMRFIQFAQQGA